MHKFFTPKELINGDVAKIIGDDVKHIYKVLRISEGEKVTLNANAIEIKLSNR